MKKKSCIGARDFFLVISCDEEMQGRSVEHLLREQCKRVGILAPKASYKLSSQTNITATTYAFDI